MDQIIAVLDRISGVITPISQFVDTMVTAGHPVFKSLLRFYNDYKQASKDDDAVVVTDQPVENWLEDVVPELYYHVQGVGEGQFIMDRETVLSLREALESHWRGVPITVIRRPGGDFDLKIHSAVVGSIRRVNGVRSGRVHSRAPSAFPRHSQEEVDSSPAVMFDATTRAAGPRVAYVYSARRGGNSVQVPATVRESAVYSEALGSPRRCYPSRFARCAPPVPDGSTVYAGSWSRRHHDSSRSRSDTSSAVYVCPNSRGY